MRRTSFVAIWDLEKTPAKISALRRDGKGRKEEGRIKVVGGAMREMRSRDGCQTKTKIIRFQVPRDELAYR